jgi:hypothetical protein
MPWLCPATLSNKNALRQWAEGTQLICGELGIRTPGACNSSTVFKTAAIDHSANSPGSKVQNRGQLANCFLLLVEKRAAVGEAFDGIILTDSLL